ncbi:MAG: bifunctional 5,10-methylenetetrahydrofolate dehydrogenase/5,10-methenyltetrahydrofolate cyclohydrolase [Candidatus Levyibacteriota bacterium]
MKLTGKTITDHLYTNLQERVKNLAKRNIQPHLVVLLVGSDPASMAYIKQKQKQAEFIGAKVTVMSFPTTITTGELVEKIELLNVDPFVHGILIQRPLPEHIDAELLAHKTNPEKDIDGFHPDSPYTLPLPLAILKILEYIYSNRHPKQNEGSQTKKDSSVSSQNDKFRSWLQTQNIVVLGKGETGGQPIIAYLQKHKLNPQVIDSKTKNSESMIQEADIVISAVGKAEVIKAEDLKSNAILLGVGMRSGEGKKLHGDFDEEAVENKVSVYTPTPRGVGPVNVAMLMENLVTATEKQTKN